MTIGKCDNADTSLALISREIATSLGDESFSEIRTRNDLRRKLFEYYERLGSVFPSYVKWDGDEFEFADWDAAFIVNYQRGKCELGYTPAMFPRDKQKLLLKMTQGTCDESPSDIILPLYMPDYSRLIIVPFIDVKRLYSIWFNSHSEAGLI